MGSCPHWEDSQHTSIDINLQNNERIVSLTMIAQKGYFQGFNLDTEDAYGTHKSYLAGFNRYNGEMIALGHNSDSTYQVKGGGY